MARGGCGQHVNEYWRGTVDWRQDTWSCLGISETPSSSAPRLVDSAEPAAIVVNGRCIVVERAGVRSVLVNGVPVYRYDVGDKVAERLFDRGGWSPKLFKWMEQKGFDVLTYRKGKVEPLSDDEFEEVEVPGSEGKEHYDLADTEVHVGTIRFPGSHLRLRFAVEGQDCAN